MATKKPANQHTKRAFNEGRAEGLEEGRKATVAAIENAAVETFFGMNLDLVIANDRIREQVELIYRGYEAAWRAARAGTQ